MARGGKREGAGRKKGLATIKAEEARKYTVQRIVDELDPILTAQIELAKGVYHEVEDEDGVRRVYQKLPDARVAAFLINQTIGRAKESAEIEIKSFSLVALAQARDRLVEEKGRNYHTIMAPVEESEL